MREFFTSSFLNRIMNKVIAIISTDWHISEENGDLIKELIRQKVSLAHQNECKLLIGLGDIFESRKSQKEHVINTFTDILDYMEGEGLKFICIPGNHDKVNYGSDRSYLTPFRTHPALTLIEGYRKIDLGGKFDSIFIPFFEETKWLEQLKKNESKIPQILFSHQALTGSKNNNGSEVESIITQNHLKSFKKVFLGHYHNKQQVGKNIHHLPSICQNNFGEDEEKGFTLLLEDGTHIFEKSLFPIYKNIEIDYADENFVEKISQVKNFSKEGNLFLKVKIKGSNSECDSIDTNELKKLGIKVDLRRDELEISPDSFSPVSFDTDEAILECFNEFCEKENLNKDEGLIYLQKMLKNEK